MKNLILDLIAEFVSNVLFVYIETIHFIKKAIKDHGDYNV